mmetsp:Transcript_26385/g.34355  ORF Transcript_26385/g.34355 Transcript_26385/m.34355 type:complete len:167 (-) Transcript_26385:1566-2066(-)
MEPAATPSGYPRLRISGMPIFPIAAQVAGEEPDIAANKAQAPRLDITSPPGTRVNHLSNASYKSAPALVDAIEAPIIMNIGIERSAKLSSLPNNISGSNSNERKPSKMSRKTAETTSNPVATEIPEKRTNIVARATIAPSVSGSIIFLPQCRKVLRRPLELPRDRQ